MLMIGDIMPRTGLSKEEIIEKAAMLANERGLAYLTVTTLSDYLGIKKPSLYNYMKTIDDVYKNIMIYGWRKVSEEIVEEICLKDAKTNLMVYGRKVYKFALDNPGVFEAMLWYNKFEDEETKEATGDLFAVIFKVMESMNISHEKANHLIRTFRSFLEGFSLLVNNGAFGNPISIKESFDLSVDVLIAGVKTLEE